MALLLIKLCNMVVHQYLTVSIFFKLSSELVGGIPPACIDKLLRGLEEFVRLQ